MDIINDIFTVATGSINVSLIIVLLAIGAICKHAFTKLNNDTIPVIMLVTGAVLAIIINLPFNPQKELLNVLVQGFVSGAAAVGLHTQGKTIYNLFTPKVDADEEAKG
mgnify:CR=1 FL=1